MLQNIIPFILFSLTSIKSASNSSPSTHHHFYYEEGPLGNGLLPPSIELMEAIKSKNIPLVEEMLSANNFDLNTRGSEVFKVPFIRAKRENPNIAGVREFAPLHVAVANDQPAMIKVLIDHGANPNSKVRSSLSRPLDFVTSPESLAQLKANQQHLTGSDRNSLLHHLSSRGYYLREGDGSVMSWLPEIKKLQNQSYVNQMNDFGETALHCAARDHGMNPNPMINQCYKEIIEYLLTIRADPNMKDNVGKRPYDLAPAPSSKNIVRQALKDVTTTKWNFLYI